MPCRPSFSGLLFAAFFLVHFVRLPFFALLLSCLYLTLSNWRHVTVLRDYRGLVEEEEDLGIEEGHGIAPPSGKGLTDAGYTHTGRRSHTHDKKEEENAPFFFFLLQAELKKRMNLSNHLDLAFHGKVSLSLFILASSFCLFGRCFLVLSFFLFSITSEVQLVLREGEEKWEISRWISSSLSGYKKASVFFFFFCRCHFALESRRRISSSRTTTTTRDDMNSEKGIGRRREMVQREGKKEKNLSTYSTLHYRISYHQGSISLSVEEGTITEGAKKNTHVVVDAAITKHVFLPRCL